MARQAVKRRETGRAAEGISVAPRDPRALIGAQTGDRFHETRTVPAEARRGRGALTNQSGRFEPQSRVDIDDGWDLDEELSALRTEVQVERPRKIITRNDSPDISFDRSINPYRGCEHGCIYCFARPTHAYMGLSPGLDFETKLFVKEGAAELLERELAASNYAPRTIAMGTNTDPYQPIERQYRVTRSVLEVLDRTNHPVGIVTKSALILRDLDVLDDDLEHRPGARRRHQVACLEHVAVQRIERLGGPHERQVFAHEWRVEECRELRKSLQSSRIRSGGVG